MTNDYFKCVFCGEYVKDNRWCTTHRDDDSEYVAIRDFNAKRIYRRYFHRSCLMRYNEEQRKKREERIKE